MTDGRPPWYPKIEYNRDQERRSISCVPFSAFPVPLYVGSPRTEPPRPPPLFLALEGETILNSDLVSEMGRRASRDEGAFQRAAALFAVNFGFAGVTL